MPYDVLLVDDDVNILAALVALLADSCTLRVARSGEDALAQARRQPPELMLLDVQMPGIDGYEVCRRMGRDPLLQDVPVVFLSALGDVQAEIAGLQAGAVDFIVKPPRGPVVAQRIANQVRLKRSSDALRAAALRDGLTGVANRRMFDATLAREWLRAQRNLSPLSLALIDVDHFKAFNDREGHAAGDEALRRVAGALAAAVRRPADLLARFGGEEFAALLPMTAAEGARELAGRLGEAVRALAQPHARGVGGRLTVSVGVATLRPAPRPGNAPAGAPSGATSGLMPLLMLGQTPDPAPPCEATQALIEAADRALYRAKQAGRDRVCFVEHDLGDPHGPGEHPEHAEHFEHSQHSQHSQHSLHSLHPEHSRHAEHLGRLEPLEPQEPLRHPEPAAAPRAARGNGGAGR